MTTLCKGGFIDVKYSRGELYCIAPLKTYTEEPPAPESVEAEPILTEEPKRFKIDAVLVSSFFGSILGSMLITLIFAFV